MPPGEEFPVDCAARITKSNIVLTLDFTARGHLWNNLYQLNTFKLTRRSLPYACFYHFVHFCRSFTTFKEKRNVKLSKTVQTSPIQRGDSNSWADQKTAVNINTLSTDIIIIRNFLLFAFWRKPRVSPTTGRSLHGLSLEDFWLLPSERIGLRTKYFRGV